MGTLVFGDVGFLLTLFFNISLLFLFVSFLNKSSITIIFLTS